MLNYNKTDYTMDTLTANIQSVLDRATPEQFINGAVWYMEANRFARAIAADLNVPVWLVALVIAATSTRNRWVWDLETGGNLNSAVQVIEAVQDGRKPDSIKIPTFNRGKFKAFDIVEDFYQGKTEMEYFQAKYFATSQKTWAFANNILNPDSSEYVTIDGHATHLAISPNVKLNLDVAQSLSARNRYAVLEQAYRIVAANNNVKAWQVQAVTWEVYRAM